MKDDLHATDTVVRPPNWAAVDKRENASYFPALDGVRGLAILLVVTYHGFDHFYKPHLGWSSAFLLIPHLGWLGVPIFFTLSGFLVSMPFWQAREKERHWYPRNYAAKRIIRIYPSYYLSLVLIAIASGYVTGRWTEYFAAGIVFIKGLAFYGWSPIYFNNVYWSLFVETRFYVLLPFFFWALSRLRPPAAATWLIIICLVVAFLNRWWVVASTPGSSEGVMDEWPQMAALTRVCSYSVCSSRWRHITVSICRSAAISAQFSYARSRRNCV